MVIVDLYNLVGRQVLADMGEVYALDLGSITATLAGFGVSPGQQMLWIIGAFNMIFDAQTNKKERPKPKNGKN